MYLAFANLARSSFTDGNGDIASYCSLTTGFVVAPVAYFVVFDFRQK